MTRGEFAARYALLDEVAGGAVRSHHAVTPAGAVVMVHFLDGGVTDGTLALLALLERLEPARRALVREVTAVDGAITVVTDRLPGFRSLADWLGARAGAPDPAPARATGEFTRMFKAGDPAGWADPVGSAGSVGSLDPADSVDSVDSEHGAQPAPAAGSGSGDRERRAPGEFTRTFLAMDRPGAAPTPVESVQRDPTHASAWSIDATGSSPSQRDAMQIDPADSHPPKPEPVQSDSKRADSGAEDGPGEFTRTFLAMEAPDGGPSSGTSFADGDGASSRIFRVADLPPPSTPSPMHAGGKAEDTIHPDESPESRGLMGSGGGFRAPSWLGGSPASPAPAPSLDAEPGAYTRMFQRMEAGGWEDDALASPSSAPVDETYAERLHVPSPEPAGAPAWDDAPPRASAEAPPPYAPAPAPSPVSPPVSATPTSAVAAERPRGAGGGVLAAVLVGVIVLALLVVVFLLAG